MAHHRKKSWTNDAGQVQYATPMQSKQLGAKTWPGRASDAVGQFILRDKLLPPAPKAHVILRPRLTAILKANIDKKLILVVADAGYGKTTLLSQLVSLEDVPCAYYDLDQRDSDFGFFFAYLVSGLEGIRPGLVERSRRLLRGRDDFVKNHELAMGMLVNELLEKAGGKIRIILDDYHCLDVDSVVHKAVDFAIEHLPPSVQMIVASRTTPPLPSLARWCAKQDLFVLSREDLAFSTKEVGIFWRKVSRVRLPRERVKLISERTEGWVTGIQLILLSIGKGRVGVKDELNRFHEADEPLFEYFAHEVLQREPTRISDFMKQTSILRVVTSEACREVLGLRNAGTLLRVVEQRNLFLSRLAEGQYKYHPLFRDFLENQLAGDTKLRLHARAARYFNKRGQSEEAIEHHLRAGQHRLAGRAIVRMAETIQEQARFATLKSWLDRMPASEIARQPLLLVVQGKMYRSQGKVSEAELLYERAEKSLRKAGDWTSLTDLLLERGRLGWMKGQYSEALRALDQALSTCPRSATALLGRILNLKGWILLDLGELKKAKTYIMRARRAHGQSKCYSELVMVEANLGTVLVCQGEVRRAYALLKRLIEETRGNYWWGVGILYSKAAKAALDLGQTGWAEQCLHQGQSVCGPCEDPVSTSELSHSLGLLYTATGQWAKAVKHFEAALKGFINLSWLSSEIAVNIDLARIYCYQREIRRAVTYVHRAEEKLAMVSRPLGPCLRAELTLLRASLGDTMRAQKDVKISVRLARQSRDARAGFFNALSKSLISLESNDSKNACAQFSQAARIARQLGYDGILMREARNDTRLGDLAQNCCDERAYLQLLGLTKAETDLRLRVKFFGGLRIEEPSGRLIHVRWPTKKTMSLFAYLVACRDSPIEREILTERLWPGLDKIRGSENFRSTASRMRQSLSKALSNRLSREAVFSYRQGRYRFLPSVEIEVDVETFEQLIHEATTLKSPEGKNEKIAHALRLFEGDYLPEIYDQWTDYPRGKARRQRLEALSWQARFAAERDDDRGCTAACEAYLEIDPLSEETARIYMKVLCKSGRVSAAKACYKALKESLWQRLRSAPAQETRDLYQALLNSASVR